MKTLSLPFVQNSNRVQSFRGVLQIVRFNWPFYTTAALVISVAGVASPVLDGWPNRVATIVWALTAYWTIASLLASHWVYDRSALARWDWIGQYVAQRPRRAANLHAGFDETSRALQRIFPQTAWRIWDFYDPTSMSEPSIERARRVSVGPAAEPVRSVSLPARNDELDSAFLIFAAHELRSPKSRETFFIELRRILRPGGTLLLVEHMRDLPNFLAYGPGFLHFFGRAEWLRLADVARFEINHELRVTPFVRVFILRRSS